MAAGILVFPCKCPAAGETTGILNIPTNISNIFHCTIAALLFASFAYMIGFRFTKSSRSITDKKKQRNKVYLICAGIIVLFMISQVITSLLKISWMTIVNEAFMLWAFSFAWLVKSDKIKYFTDKK